MTERECGGCTLCCKLLPIKAFAKPAGHRCQHQRWGKGCAIYRQEGFPFAECGLWHCKWLINDDADDLPRPDRAHYVLDMIPDYVTVNAPGRQPTTVPVVQIWLDPHYPEAHRSPELRQWLYRRGAQGWAALIRFDAYEAMILLPPQMTDSGRFEEIGGDSVTRREGDWSAEETAAKLQEAGVYPT